MLLKLQGGGANGLRPLSMVKLWMAKVRPVLESGAEIWGGEISATYAAKIESIQNKFGRAVLGIKTMAAAAGVRAELGLPTLRSRRLYLKLGYWEKLCRAESERLLSIIFRNRYAEVAAGGGLHSLTSTTTGYLALCHPTGVSGCELRWLAPRLL